MAYFTFRLYSVLRRTRALRTRATITVFLVVGLAHDLVGIAVIGRFTAKSIFVFLSFGVLSLVSRWAQTALQQRRWPPILNGLVNAALVYVSFRFGGILVSAFPM